MNASTYDNIKKAILRMVAARPLRVEIPVECPLNQETERSGRECPLSRGNCRKCALEIAKLVYFEILKSKLRATE